MTPQQRAALIEACEAGDEVRCTTIALQICATAAREGRSTAARNIRTFLDGMRNREAAEQAYRLKRIDIVTKLAMLNPSASVPELVEHADRIISACAEAPLP